MKKLLVLVGPQGSGKTTFCSSLSDYTRISQDDQGKHQHFQLFKEAILRGDNVVVDRINHTKEQRKKYIDIAKENNYYTVIKVMNEPYKVCFDRIKLRPNHPTLSSIEDDTIIHKALGMYFNKYEFPTKDEANQVIYSSYDPYMYDITDKYDYAFIVGDLHGCEDEFFHLMNQCINYMIDNNIDAKDTCIILAGGIVDRGPKIKECIDLLKSKDLYCVRGNHEDKLIRWLKDNPVKISGGLEKTIEQLGPNLDKNDLICRLENLPYMIKFGNSHIVHAGINPKYDIHNQIKEVLIYVRTLGTGGRLNDPLSAEWFSNYNGVENIFFGHEYHLSPYVHKNVYALDGHCVFGYGQLRGALVHKNGMVRRLFSTKSCQPLSIEKPEEDELHSCLEPYEKLVKEGILRKAETEDLILYNYTDKCVYEKLWNHFTINSRGLIFEKTTGKVIAKPFSKFFNLNETEETKLENLPDEPYVVSEKLDGSLGIIFNYKGSWRVATRGSFNSDQAVKAQELLKNYNLNQVNPEITLLVEIIYPENKIIVNYGKEEKLVLLGMYYRELLEEMEGPNSLELWGSIIGMEVAKSYNYTIGQMIDFQKIIDKDMEGFVVKFSNGLRVKIKGEEYLKLAKLISGMSPIGLWETMKYGKVDRKYLSQLPEEFRSQYEAVAKILEDRYKEILSEIYETANQAPVNTLDGENRKKLGLWIKDNNPSHGTVLFSFLDLPKKEDAVDKYIMKIIRPKGNVL